jgi:hypothetical protein
MSVSSTFCPDQNAFWHPYPVSASSVLTHYRQTRLPGFKRCPRLAKKPAGPSSFSGRLFTVMARLTCFMSAAKPENQPDRIAQHAIAPKIRNTGSFPFQIMAMPPFTCRVWPVM